MNAPRADGDHQAALAGGAIARLSRRPESLELFVETAGHVVRIAVQLRTTIGAEQSRAIIAALDAAVDAATKSKSPDDGKSIGQQCR